MQPNSSGYILQRKMTKILPCVMDVTIKLSIQDSGITRPTHCNAMTACSFYTLQLGAVTDHHATALWTLDSPAAHSAQTLSVPECCRPHAAHPFRLLCLTFLYTLSRGPCTGLAALASSSSSSLGSRLFCLSRQSLSKQFVLPLTFSGDGVSTFKARLRVGMKAQSLSRSSRVGGGVSSLSDGGGESGSSRS